MAAGYKGAILPHSQKPEMPRHQAKSCAKSRNCVSLWVQSGELSVSLVRWGKVPTRLHFSTFPCFRRIKGKQRIDLAPAAPSV